MAEGCHKYKKKTPHGVANVEIMAFNMENTTGTEWLLEQNGILNF
jgi:hypothetical protein